MTWKLVLIDIYYYDSSLDNLKRKYGRRVKMHTSDARWYNNDIIIL